MGPTTFDVYIWGFVETQKWFWWTFNKTTPDSVRSRLNSLRARPGQAGTARSGECNVERERERELELRFCSSTGQATDKSNSNDNNSKNNKKSTYFIFYLLFRKGSLHKSNTKWVRHNNTKVNLSFSSSLSLSLKTAIQFQIQTEIRFASSIRPVDQHINWKWK